MTIISSIPLFGTGAQMAVDSTNGGNGSEDQPYVMALSVANPISGIPVFGTGSYLGVASGNGSQAQPYVLSVSLVGGAGSSLPFTVPASQVVVKGDGSTQVGTNTQISTDSYGNVVLDGYSSGGSGAGAIGFDPAAGTAYISGAITLDSGAIATDGGGDITFSNTSNVNFNGGHATGISYIEFGDSSTQSTAGIPQGGPLSTNLNCAGNSILDTGRVSAGTNGNVQLAGYDGTNFYNIIQCGYVTGQQQLGFFANEAPQQTPQGNTNTPSGGSGSPVLVDTTFDGGLGGAAFTIGDIVLALKNYGLLS